MKNTNKIYLIILLILLSPLKLIAADGDFNFGYIPKTPLIDPSIIAALANSTSTDKIYGHAYINRNIDKPDSSPIASNYINSGKGSMFGGPDVIYNPFYSLSVDFYSTKKITQILFNDFAHSASGVKLALTLEPVTPINGKYHYTQTFPIYVSKEFAKAFAIYSESDMANYGPLFDDVCYSTSINGNSTSPDRKIRISFYSNTDQSQQNVYLHSANSYYWYTDANHSAQSNPFGQPSTGKKLQGNTLCSDQQVCHSSWVTGPCITTEDWSTTFCDENADCADENKCVTSTCNLNTYTCVQTYNNNSCDDGNNCTTGDICNNGQCLAGQPLNCNDGDACTTDSCDPGKGICKHESKGPNCSSCQTNSDCDDNNPCTNDQCIPQGANGSQCLHAPKAYGTACDDNNNCTSSSQCEYGECKSGNSININDNNPCTADSCDPKAGVIHTPLNGTACNDNNNCTTVDTCQSGLCTGSGAPNIDDNNPCTADSCDSKSGIKHTPLTGTSCSDGNACTSGDSCQNGICKAGETNICGECQSNTDCAAKEDGNLCNGTLICQNNACIVDPKTIITCQASTNTCETNSCNPNSGKCEIKAASEGAICDDANACTSESKCTAGKCKGIKMIDKSVIDDGDKCTFDLCDIKEGVKHTPIAGCEPDECQADSDCKGVAKECNKFICNGGACEEIPVSDGTLCSDNDMCTQGDSCQKGACVAKEPVTCEAQACTLVECKNDKGCVATHDPACDKPADPCGEKDADGDGIGDLCDNCPDIDNKDQMDTDKDGVGNACDTCAYVANPGDAQTKDENEDGLPDACNAVCKTCCCQGPDCPKPDCFIDPSKDPDGDGWNNAIPGCDLCPGISNPDGKFQYDSNNDGVLDTCDPQKTLICNGETEDSDHDGIPDKCDNCPNNANPDQKDDDGNGIGNSCEPLKTEDEPDVEGNKSAAEDCTALGGTLENLSPSFDISIIKTIDPAEMKLINTKGQLNVHGVLWLKEHGFVDKDGRVILLDVNGTPTQACNLQTGGLSFQGSGGCSLRL